MTVIKKEKQDLEFILNGIEKRGDSVVNTKWQLNKKIDKIQDEILFSKMTIEELFSLYV